MNKIYRSTKVLFLGGLLFGLSVFFVSCNKQSSEGNAGQPSLEVRTSVVEKGDALVLKKYTASLEGRVNVEVRAQASGYIDKILVEEGSYVKKGQALILIDAQPYQIQLNNANASLKAAQAALVNAQLEKDKVQSLLDNSFVSPIQLKTAQAVLDNAKANVAQAEAAVAEAKLNLSYCTIKAPVDGFLGRITKRVGNLVTAGEVEELTTMSDISQMFAYFSLTEADYFNLVKENGGSENVLKMPIELELSNGDKYPISGKVDVINGEFDAGTNSISVRAVFDNPDRLLRNGGTGIVNLMATHKDAVQVPIAATADLQDKIFAYVVNKDNTVDQRQLKIIGKNLHTYFIADGVKEGETLVTTGVDKLQDGMTVTVLSAAKNAGGNTSTETAKASE
ncbi:efflux RND transporter periplasmic adaptor subunit [Myroides odoratimimus]|uniref:efflux RND transporter periplasmic adaptor subunit n=1 Tax=Myroides odoratimimus TaxID=76832 RepID=UPI00046AA298|nr:efflux RND transporter periplasmic adaptor subunit [Myroides odoratimimus]